MAKKIEFRWRNGFDVALVVAKMNKGRKQENGKVSYLNASLSENIGVFGTALIGPGNIRQEVLEILLNKALFRPTHNGKINPEIILEFIEREYREYMRLPVLDYYLVTSWSYQGTFPIHRWHIDDCVVSFGIKGDKFYKAGKKGRGSISEDLKHLRISQQEKSYPLVSVKTKARSHREAFEKSQDTLDLIRAITNLPFNERIGIRFTSSQREPINSIRTGPAHTLHRSNGDMIENFWYEPEFVEPLFLAKFSDRIPPGYFRYWKRVLQSSNLANETKQGLVQYVRALDAPDPMKGFQELWAILEFLSATQPGQDFGVTVRRVSALYKDRQIQFEYANHLRIRRNRAIHFSRNPSASSRESEVMICQAKRFVESFLWFYARYGRVLESRDEVGEFLDLRDKLNEFGKSKRIMKLAEQLYTWER